VVLDVGTTYWAYIDHAVNIYLGGDVYTGGRAYINVPFSPNPTKFVEAGDDAVFSATFADPVQPAAVPLPAAVWAGAGLMMGMGVWRGRRVGSSR
jgi:hypothetical protein